jgi:hypothetical protein
LAGGLDTKTRKHDICVMKNVTITLPDDLAREVRVQAARQDKSLSRFIADVLAERCGAGSDKDEDKLGALREFFYGPGYPGISKNWRGREALYAEREDELLRRYESHRLRDGSRSGSETDLRPGFSEPDHHGPRSGAEPAESQRVLPRRHRKAKSDAKK